MKLSRPRQGENPGHLARQWQLCEDEHKGKQTGRGRRGGRDGPVRRCRYEHEAGRGWRHDARRTRVLRPPLLLHP